LFRVSSPALAPANAAGLTTRRQSRHQELPFGEQLGRSSRQEIGIRPTHVQNPSPVPAPAPVVHHPVAATPPPVQTADNPAGLRRLTETLNALGMSTSGLQVHYEEQPVYYPGGSYTNRDIVVSNGTKTERFSHDLTLRNPLITAAEIQRYFGIAATASPRGVIQNV